MNKILIVDDELSIRESFSLILGEKYRLLLAASGEAALKYAAGEKIDLAYLDIRMPGLDGLETLNRLKEIDPAIEAVMITAVNDVSKASEAIKYGARDYIIKPFDVNAILKLTDSILRKKSLEQEGENIRKETGKGAARLVGQSEKIEMIRKTVSKIASKNLRVLILGEPGTEKDAVAELIHENGRAEFPLLTLNLSPTMSQTGIRTALFGKSSGGTTADLQKKTGLIESARGGTLFLNNVEYLPAGLLAAPAEARLIAGSSANLAESSKENYEYFSEVLLGIPPLRERLSDLPLLTKRYLELFGEQYAREVELGPEIEEIFSNYDWPGNTAQLKSLMKRLVINAGSGKITPADLPVDLLLKAPGAPGADYFSNFEREYCRRILEESGGDKERAAAVLEINQALLESKL
ncbi:hypothetical protein A2625_05870 [candidate division WOR-1 bacterium RIFCSPHIGHO2_01_FULL_53_15]|uniref:Sigma-54-dependent Fis family transcriptional regulator n=1 Tax=candidate division WOR-1 bacterium RIFCSPHIGHO2_01_FULL_53_15 TaxID=1802564 RepID=A0A1F4Q322_UNCSA|nr:MAG: hypothetical protein A2625_05870 [candidate division WOR-1 bacterium RIFCSPHIGHO2_01_FULL_53_15]OGC13878.1 MAG: hypothetical protein A3D23_02350 [candidate division WOR-1 bacterium RIFCSPHIGHO2_02_FULL_53_26]